jgi:transcription antitermination factor NusG
MSKRWYVLHARSGYEAKVKTAIEEAIDREGLSDLLGDVMIPTEKVVEYNRYHNHAGCLNSFILCRPNNFA